MGTKKEGPGGIIFLEIWDHTGLVQVVINPETDVSLHERAKQLRSEYVVAIKGTVKEDQPVLKILPWHWKLRGHR